MSASRAPVATADAVRAAYDECEVITRREAKNFAYGIRLLKAPERRAMSAAYALARRIDDVGDGEAPAEEKLLGLADLRAQLAAVESGTPSGDPVLTAVTDATQRYGLPLAAFGEIIDGCELDVRGTTYDTIDDLVAYCRLVAGSVGRISLAVFGTPDPRRAEPLADALGVALQLTNILRDVAEDKAMGRTYLPRADAEAVGCPPSLDAPAPVVARLVGVECEVARRWFADGLQLLPLLDRRSRACVSAMAGIYRRLLERIASDPSAVLDRRVSLPGREKAWVAMRSLSGATP